MTHDQHAHSQGLGEAINAAADPDNAEALLAAGYYAPALLALEPRTRAGEPAATQLVVWLTTHPQADLRSVRLPAALLLNQVGDPRYAGAGWLPDMVEIPAGPFLMGSTSHEPALCNETPQHTLHLPTYWMGRTPVTNAQWRRFIEAGGYTTERYWTRAGWVQRAKLGQPTFWDYPRFSGDNQPVMGVAWVEALAYCAWLSEVTGRLFTLPSEAQWEKAARGPYGQVYPWGNSWEVDRCNSGEVGLGQTTPVGIFPAGASPYGLLDMAGNIFEWCVTKKDKRYPYASDEDEWSSAYLERPHARCIRGGGYQSRAFDMRGARRHFIAMSHFGGGNFGVRVVSWGP